jgi:hypothetical protein
MAPPSSRRKHAMLRLIALLGLPLALVSAIWAGGVIAGARIWPHSVLEAETKWFGQTVDAKVLESARTREETRRARAQSSREVVESSVSQAMTSTASPSAAQGETGTPLEKVTTNVQATAASLSTAAGVANAPSEARIPPEDVFERVEAPTDPHLRAAWERPRTINLEFVYEAEVAQRDPSWLANAQHLIRWANLAYEQTLGIKLELRGARVLREDHADRKRESRDLALAQDFGQGPDFAVVLVAEEASAASYFQETSLGETHCRSVLAGAPAGIRNATTLNYSVSVVQAIGRCLGALPLEGGAAGAASLSWMDLAANGWKGALYLDAANRQRLLERKMREFAATPAVVPETGNP